MGKLVEFCENSKQYDRDSVPTSIPRSLKFPLMFI